MRRKAVAHPFERVQLGPFDIELEDVHAIQRRRHTVNRDAFHLERLLAIGGRPQP